MIVVVTVMVFHKYGKNISLCCSQIWKFKEVWLITDMVIDECGNRDNNVQISEHVVRRYVIGKNKIESQGIVKLSYKITQSRLVKVK